MQQKVICTTVLMLALCLAAGAAKAGDCRPVNARSSPAVWLDPPCYFQGVEYSYCAEVPIRGTLNGTWHAYFPEIYWEQVSEPLPPGFSDLFSNWYLSRIVTNQGEIWAQSAEILHLDAFFTLGTLAGNFWVFGGTDAYEGASGWMGHVWDPRRNQGAGGSVMIGEICTP